MTEYIGIALHKAKSFVTRMDARGQILEQVNLAHASGALQQYLQTLPADARLAVEATGNWMWLYELIEDQHPNLVLAHPLKTRAIASARIKTDKIDATTLAYLLRTELLPTAYIPPRAIRDQRERLRYRASLIRLRTQVKNKIAAIVRKTGVQPPTKTAFGVKSRQFLAAAPVRACYRLALDGSLAGPLDHRNPARGSRPCRASGERCPGATAVHHPRNRDLLGAAHPQRDWEHSPVSRQSPPLLLCRLGAVGAGVRRQDARGRAHQARLGLVAVDSGRSVGPRDPWRPTISIPLLSSCEEPRA